MVIETVVGESVLSTVGKNSLQTAEKKKNRPMTRPFKQISHSEVGDRQNRQED